MAEKMPQTYENHAKLVPMYHYVLAPILVANLVIAAFDLRDGLSLEAAMGVVMALALLAIALFARTFALGVQDRVIRLEERLRLARLLPEDLQPRIENFTVDQVCALRFASDEELPELARKVLEDGLADRKTIKQLVRTWRPDYQRI